MIVMVLFKVIALFNRLNDLQGYYSVQQNFQKKVVFFVTNVCKKATLICFQVCKILWQVLLLALKS